MNIALYSLKGEQIGTHELSDALYDAKANPTLVFEVVNAYAANARQVLAHTKGKGDVAGGGKKPWKQKGTGRARHGSIRSPLWVGGGVTFGPRKGRVFAKKINKGSGRKALSILLSDRVRDNNLILVDSLVMELPKTKTAASFVTKVVKSGKTLVVHHNNASVVRAFSNIPRVEVVRAEDVNAADIIKAGTVVASVEAIEIISTRLAK